jgi:hypothetical protein
VTNAGFFVCGEDLAPDMPAAAGEIADEEAADADGMEDGIVVVLRLVMIDLMEVSLSQRRPECPTHDSLDYASRNNDRSARLYAGLRHRA